MTVEEQAEQ